MKHLLETGVDEVICIDELKMAILAQSCVCPGLSTLFDNLVRSFSTPGAELDHPDKDHDWMEECVNRPFPPESLACVLRRCSPTTKTAAQPSPFPYRWAPSCSLPPHARPRAEGTPEDVTLSFTASIYPRSFAASLSARLRCLYSAHTVRR